MTRFSAVIFDLDGTLVDSGRLVAQSAIDAFRHFALPVPTAAAVIAYMGIPIEVYFAKLAGPAFETIDPGALYADYRARFKVMVEAGELQAYEGIPEILAGLKEAGVLIGIATSKETRPAIHSCEHAGLAPYIDAYVGSDMVQAYKPAPDTALKCLEAFGLSAGPNICVVGDAEGDIAMGREAAATTCGVTWGAHDATRLSRQSPAFIAHTRGQLRDFLGLGAF
ncbi:MAG: HAD family hydrolase [Rhodospirillales bacterium]|nr:HAD family hydrolase [Alphaproteobacteria bacterium]MCB9986546.1 HAD family hydrolase [Rhodospirillales bacterium]USO06919.1 MAG: HAD family hydrolase [Rhodospirillales bacterium]